MKAIVQEQYGSPDGLHLRDVPTPTAQDDEVLVRVCAASLNAADWHLMRRLPHLIGTFVLRRRPSRIRGGDMAGIVEAVGRNVTTIKPGDEVFGAAKGTLSEYAVTAATRVAAKPRNLTFAEAATLAGAGCTALQGLRDYAHLQAGERVLVYGAGGGVGTFAVQVAKALGAHVTAVTRADYIPVMRSIRADEVIDYTKDDFTARAAQYDVVFDIGADRPPAACARALRRNGRLVLVGAPKQMRRLVLMLFRSMRARKDPLRLAYVARIDAADLFALRDLAEAGKLTPVIDREYELSDAPDAFRYLGTRAARGKVVITMAQRVAPASK